MRKLLPSEDPGPPFYARVGLQILDDNGYVAIPFYRPPAMVPDTFNLLQMFDFPLGPTDPGAFKAPLLMTGFLLIEADAPLGAFPKQVQLTGDAVPVWFAPSAAFHAAVQDGGLTLAELIALEPLMGIATHYRETLHPRAGEHKIIIQARGTLEDGSSFSLHVTHVHDELKSIKLVFGT